jgi:hypothetical protein
MKSGRGCPICQRENASKLFREKIDVVINKVSEVGGNILNPEDYINNTTKNLQITCPLLREPILNIIKKLYPTWRAGMS